MEIDFITVVMILAVLLMAFMMGDVIYQEYSRDKQCQEMGYDFAARDSFGGTSYCQNADDPSKPRPWLKSKQ